MLSTNYLKPNTPTPSICHCHSLSVTSIYWIHWYTSLWAIYWLSFQLQLPTSIKPSSKTAVTRKRLQPPELAEAPPALRGISPASWGFFGGSKRCCQMGFAAKKMGFSEHHTFCKGNFLNYTILSNPMHFLFGTFWRMVYLIFNIYHAFHWHPIPSSHHLPSPPLDLSNCLHPGS